MTAANMRNGVASRGRAAATLLVVDDQPLSAEYMVSIAEDRGWVAIAACTPGEAEAQLGSASPAAVVLDLDMPGRDGVQMLRYLSERDYDGSVFIVSACDEAIVETSARLGREMGLRIIGYAQKPVTEEHFAELLQQSALQWKH